MFFNRMCSFQGSFIMPLMRVLMLVGALTGVPYLKVIGIIPETYNTQLLSVSFLAIGWIIWAMIQQYCLTYLDDDDEWEPLFHILGLVVILLECIGMYHQGWWVIVVNIPIFGIILKKHALLDVWRDDMFPDRDEEDEKVQEDKSL